jgi:flagellar hook-associated protein 2
MATTSSILDVASLVSQLMKVERKPIDKLNAKITDIQARISSFGTLNSLVSTLQSSAQSLKTMLQSYSATPSDANLFSATASTSAAAGSYTISISKLAQAQNLVAAGQASQTVSIPSLASTVTFTIGGNPMAVTIQAGATLQDIRDAINGANLGITASIVNDGSNAPYRLVLTADKTGVANGVSSITVQPGGDPALNDLLAFNPDANPPAAVTMTQSAVAQNASLTINGIAITSASNNVTDAIQGVTLTLKAETTTPATLTVARDTSAIESAVTKFVDSYNALATQLKSRSAYGNSTSQAGVLAGDGAVRQMLDQLRNILTTPASGGTLSYLTEIGISTQFGGTLKLDTSKLKSMLASDYAGVGNLLNSTTGFATRLSDWATSVTRAGGLIGQRTDGLNSSIKGYNDQIAKLEKRMTVLQKQYTTTYSNLNMMLSRMNDTSSYLTSQFG